LVLLQKNELNR